MIVSVVENKQIETSTTRSEVQISKITAKKHIVVNENVPSIDEKHEDQSKKLAKKFQIRIQIVYRLRQQFLSK